MAAVKRSLDRRVTRYQLGCPEGGGGSASAIALFDGISFLTADARAPYVCCVRGMRTHPDSLLVCHCRLGSMQVLMGGAVVGVLSEGEVAVVRADEGDLSLGLPNGYCRGSFLRMCLRSLTLSSRHGMSEFGIDLKGLVASYHAGSAAVLQHSIDLSHTFAELYNLLEANAPNLGYLRLKAFELLVLLQGEGPRAGQEDVGGSSLFVGRMQVAYRAQQVMTRRLSDPIGIDALARQCEVSPTLLKESFRETFGVPVGTWYRAYRIHRACELLRDERMPVSDVARAVGYASASKFSKAFADVQGVTPSAWRKERARRPGCPEAGCPCGLSHVASGAEPGGEEPGPSGVAAGAAGSTAAGAGGAAATETAASEAGSTAAGAGGAADFTRASAAARAPVGNDAPAR